MNMIAINKRQTPDARENSAVFSKTFDGRKGVDFSAFNDACEFLIARGFSIGPACIDSPCGVMYGRDWKIAKWRHLSPEQQAQLHGTVRGDRRKGPVHIAIFWAAPAFAIAAVAKPYIADRIVSTWATQR